MVDIPAADAALICGSGTFSLQMPEDAQAEDVAVVASGLVFSTPFGESPVFKLCRIGQRSVLMVRMHGWRKGVTRGAASQQLFWVLQRSGVREVLAEGGVGAVNHLLRLRDITVPSDYLDFSMRKDVGLGGDYLLSMRRPVCPRLAKKLVRTAENDGSVRVFDRGIYAVTDGRHFESRAEVMMLKQLGADMVGQSMCPEVYLAREIGACYARLDQVVNFAEGINQDWEHDDLEDIFYQDARRIGRIMIEALRSPGEGDCECSKLRFDTLLKEENQH